MNFSIKHQEEYSRGELLLRTILGWVYIGIPHYFLLSIIGIWSGILHFLAWWAILFTGKYPQSMFEFQAKYIAWGNRFGASLANLVDGYPALGLAGTSDTVKVELTNPAGMSRGKLLLRTFFGSIYVGIPHGFCLYFRAIGAAFVAFIAWWIVLFTGKYPENMHHFVVGTLRWSNRVFFYLANLTDDYPPFTGK